MLYAFVALAAAAALAGCGSSHPSAGAQTPPPPAAEPRLHPPLITGPAYRCAVESGIASRLHTPLATLETQLRSQVRVAPGSTLMSLAKPLGFAQGQLGAIVLASLDHAAEAAVRSGRWAPSEARTEKHYWTAQPAPSLIAEVTRWLVSS